MINLKNKQSKFQNKFLIKWKTLKMGVAKLILQDKNFKKCMSMSLYIAYKTTLLLSRKLLYLIFL